MEFDPLKLENQLCFPLYAAAKEVVRRYRPFLEPLGLTYTQYIAMMVMWEHGSLTAGRTMVILKKPTRLGRLFILAFSQIRKKLRCR